MEFVPYALPYRPVSTVIHVFIELNAKRSRRPLYTECIARRVGVCVEDRDEVECVLHGFLALLLQCMYFIVNGKFDTRGAIKCVRKIQLF